MWSQDRHRHIQGLLRNRGQLSTDALIRELGVSRETVRRDLRDLEAAGLLKRIHGGVVALGPAEEAPFARRMLLNRREKQAIARAAMALIEPGQSCFVDAGSTTAHLASELGRVTDVTVVTNSLEVATAIRTQRPDGDVILLGGRLISDVPATFGELTLGEIERFRVDVAFLSPVGVDVDAGATDFALHEAELARAMAAHAASIAILADASKLGVVSRVQLCPIEDIDALVTSSRAEDSLLEALGEAGIPRIIKAP